MKIGSKVKLIRALNGFDCNIYGTIVATYGLDRVIVRTLAGHEWALRKKNLKIIK